MKKITPLLLLFAISFFGYAQVNNYNVGDVVDNFTVTDTDGVVYNLYDITAEGKYVYLDFFFVDCPPCQQTASIFNEFYDKYGCNEGEIFCISINNGNDNNEEVEAYEQQYGGSFNHAPAVSNEGGGPAVDSEYGISAYPTYCLIGPDNTLLNIDIWPLSGVETFENTFPAGFEPEIMECFLGLLDDVNTSDFLLYPTVSNGSNINLRLSNQVNDVEVVVYDINGKRVFSKNYSNPSIVLNLNVIAGLYMVQVKTDTGATVKKLIIK